MLDKDDLLKENLLKFFTPKRLLIVSNVVNKKIPYSLRVIEWFILTYCKKNTVKYNVKNQIFDVYYSYKIEQLKSFNKEHFDLFRRTDRFTLKVDQNTKLETTVAQLNFFKWMIENKILDYINEHQEQIKKDMNISCKKKKTKVKFFENIIITNNKVVISFK